MDFFGVFDQGPAWEHAEVRLDTSGDAVLNVTIGARLVLSVYLTEDQARYPNLIGLTEREQVWQVAERLRDLFQVPLSSWGYELITRTGPEDARIELTDALALPRPEYREIAYNYWSEAPSVAEFGGRV